MEKREKPPKSHAKQGRKAKNTLKTSEESVETPEKTGKTGFIFGDWTFERLESDFGLKGRKLIFCVEMVACEVGRIAAIKAGYSERNSDTQASMLQRDPKVSKALAALRKAKRDNIAEACGVTAEWLINQYKHVYSICGAVKDVIRDEKVVGQELAYTDGALRALENLTKISGNMPDPKMKVDGKLKHEHSGELHHVLDFGDPDDDYSDIPGG